jgi:CRISPR-associated protein Csm1
MKDGRYLSLAHYDIGRNIIKDGKNNQKEVEMLHRIFAVGVSERPELEYLNIPLFYAINLNRD